MKIGMIGCGRIAARFADEAAFVDGVELTHVYNPHRISAVTFAEAHGLYIAASLDELFSKVDAVYIATPHATHYEYTFAALNAGKHVLCEKPFTLDPAEAEELFSLADEKGLCLMEALKTRYCPGYRALVDTARSGIIGNIVSVEAAFSRLTDTNLREYTDVSSGGSFTEFGNYCLLPVFDLLGTDYSDARFTSIPAPNGVDMYTKVDIFYRDAGDRPRADIGKGKMGDRPRSAEKMGDGPRFNEINQGLSPIFRTATAFATIKTGIGAKTEGQLLISGTDGYILVPSPWWLTKYFEVHFEDPNRIIRREVPFEGSGLRYEIVEFVRRVTATGGDRPRGEVKMGDRPRAEAKMGDCPQAENGEAEMGDSPRHFNIEVERKSIMSFERLVERFLMHNMRSEATEEQKRAVGIWAHRGCSYRFPENTLIAFEEAAKLPGITGIEMDVQYSKDHEMVVFHDETIDRVTEGSGYVKDHTVAELKALKFKNCENFPTAGIPTLREFLTDMKPYCEKGMLINIELKTSVIRYEGIERDAYNLVKELGMCDSIVWSSFLADSIKLIKEIDPNAATGMLASKFSDCVKMGDPNRCDAYHPSLAGMTGVSKAEAAAHPDRIIRAWNSDEPLYHLPRPKRALDLRNYALFGVTDIITNVPERYLTAEYAHIMEE